MFFSKAFAMRSKTPTVTKNAIKHFTLNCCYVHMNHFVDQQLSKVIFCPNCISCNANTTYYTFWRWLAYIFTIVVLIG